jgi:hypothetical protein
MADRQVQHLFSISSSFSYFSWLHYFHYQFKPAAAFIVDPPHGCCCPSKVGRIS